MSISGQIKSVIGLLNTGPSDLSSPEETMINAAEQANWTVEDGAGLNAMNMVWADKRTLAPGAENLDLYGSLFDSFGRNVDLVRVKLIHIYSVGLNAATPNQGLLKIGGGTNPFINWVADPTDILQIKPGGSFTLTAPDADGYPVTQTSADTLKIENTGGIDAVYNIVIGGALLS